MRVVRSSPVCANPDNVGFSPEYDGFTDTNIYAGQALEPGMMVRGSDVVERPTTTVVVFPGHILKVSVYGDFYIEIPQSFSCGLAAAEGAEGTGGETGAAGPTGARQPRRRDTAR